MAIGFSRLAFVKRSEGRNMCQKSAYIERSRIEFDGNCALSPKVYDYSDREAPVYLNVLLPEGVDENFKIPQVLWNAAEQAERKANSQVGLEKVLALPDDLDITLEDRIVLFENFVQKEFVDKGLAVQIAIHQPEEGKEHNWHGHILAPTRCFSEDGKDFESHKPRELLQKLSHINWGAKWTLEQNDYFRSKGLALRVDDKGLVPEKHLGAVRLRGKCFDKLENHTALKELNALEAQDPEKLLNALVSKQSTFTRDDVERLMAKHTPSEAIETVKANFWGQEKITPLKDKNTLKPSDKFSTLDVIEEEKKILRLSERIYKHRHIRIKDVHLERNLTAEQQKAFEGILNTKGLACIQGYAGTGKSHLLTALRKKYEDYNITVRGFGPDNATANLLKDKGFQAENIPKFLHAAFHENCSIMNKEVWIVDEAGKLGNRSLLELLKLADKHHVKVILAGDVDQFSSVDRGGMFKELLNHYDAHVLSDIKRQNQVLDRQIAKSLATGEMGSALDELSEKGAMHWHQNTERSMEALILDWSKDHTTLFNKKLTYVGLPSPFPQTKLKSYDSSLIVAQTNHEVRDLNEMAHNIRVAKGEISSKELRCETLFGEISVSEGDRIEFRKNDRELGVTNGMSGTLLKASEESFTVATREHSKTPKLVTFNPKEYSGYQLGYATTCFRAQGKTVSHAYVLHSKYLNKQMAYVSLTRHTKSVNYYVPEDKCKNIAHLKLSAMRDASKESTLNYTHDRELEKQKTALDRKNHALELHDSRNVLKIGKAMAFEISDGVKHFLHKTVQRLQDRRADKDFYQYQEDKTTNVKFNVSPLEDKLDKKGTVTQALAIFDKETAAKETLLKEVKSKELGAQLETERRSHHQKPPNQPLNQYWKQVGHCKEWQAVIAAEQASGLQKIENSDNFKFWQKACASRNRLAHQLTPQDKANLTPKSLEIINSQADKHDTYLKEQELRKGPSLNESLKFHIEPLLYKLFPDGPSIKTRTSFRFGSKGSLTVNHSGSKTGQFYDFEAKEGGVLIQLIQKRLGLDSHEAKTWARDFLGLATSITVSDAFQKPLKSCKELSTWVSERPPADKPPPSLKDLKMEWYWNEVARHEYRDREGNLLYQVLRLQDKYDLAKKITPPLSYGHFDGEDSSSWQLKGYKDENGRTPLYGLDKLDKNPHAIIVVVEGEKAADFGADKFLDKENHICVSWVGGVQGISKADWSPLQNRKVLVWGDNDEPGRKAQLDVCEELKKLDHVAVRAIDHNLLQEQKFPEKWDLGDAVPNKCGSLAVPYIENHAEHIIGDFHEIDTSLEKELGTNKALDKGLDLEL